MKPHRYKVIEHASFYAVRDSWTGKEARMSDGVNVLFTFKGNPMKPVTERFRMIWERRLNENPSETGKAYFPMEGL
jgi:hypothetical protein